jgi:predicted RecB family nuclease
MEESPSPQAPPAPSPPPRALASIGFGPGMTIRLSQVGIETVSDLAQANPAALRHALGDISQLINVDVWIASAQAACRAPESADAE